MFFPSLLDVAERHVSSFKKKIISLGTFSAPYYTFYSVEYKV